jgi:hypothetical protein
MNITYRRPEEAARNRRRVKVFLRQLHRDAGVPTSKLKPLVERWNGLASQSASWSKDKSEAFAQCAAELGRLVG